MHAQDDPKLAGYLKIPAEEVKKYDVFVFELCDRNISKVATNGLCGSRLKRSESLSLCRQLLEGLIQLENSDCCHNDLKPENILLVIDVNDFEPHFQLRISDFGQAGRSGGTSGWTWPKFLSERRPGKSDMYSVALLILYIMCDDREVFYRIRNNYVENRDEPWLTAFRNDPFFKLIIDMMKLNLAPKEAKDRWDQISGQVQIITKDYLWQMFGVDERYLRVQDGMDLAQLNLASVSLLDR